MCRNIKILRAPYAVGVTDDDVHAAALQYVRTVGGVRLPGPRIEEAFNQAVETIGAATRELLARLEASADQASADQASADQASADQASADQASADQASADGSPRY